MVKLNKIYTRTGDDGTTGLATGERIAKDDLRVEAYGTVDEANSAIGVAVTCVPALAPGSDERARLISRIADVLRLAQQDLFDVGADLATPIDEPEAKGEPLKYPRLRVLAVQTERLERTIDRYNEHLAPLTSFVLPGGTPLAAHLHVARTIVRRAERLAVALNRHEGWKTNPETVRYLNRLSDLLFVLGRCANAWGAGDVLWVPGATRTAQGLGLDGPPGA